MNVWTETEDGWISDMSDCTGFMPRGEEIPPLEMGWTINKNDDNEIISWTYVYPDGKIAKIIND